MPRKTRSEIDLTTEAGKREFELRLKKRKKELQRLAELAGQDVDAEPTGKLAGPHNDVDYRRDLKQSEKATLANH